MSTVAKIAQASESKSFKKLNPHLFFQKCEGDTCPICELQRTECHCFPEKPKAKKRIRQSSKPLLNRLEAEFYLQISHLGARPQAIKFKLANNAFFKPDFFSPIVMTAWEVKGPKEGKNVARGMLALKCAAFAWPEIKFILAWKDKEAGWMTQEILP